MRLLDDDGMIGWMVEIAEIESFVIDSDGNFDCLRRSLNDSFRLNLDLFSLEPGLRIDDGLECFD